MADSIERRAEHPDDTRLFDRLRNLWTTRDPVPDGLVDDLVAALAADDLAARWAQFELTSGDLAGVRGVRAEQSSDVATMEFHLGSVELVLRISTDVHGTRRLDGWLTDADEPVAPGTELVVTSAATEQHTTVDAHGRFTFLAVPDRAWRLRVDLGGNGRRFETPDLEW